MITKSNATELRHLLRETEFSAGEKNHWVDMKMELLKDVKRNPTICTAIKM